VEVKKASKEEAKKGSVNTVVVARQGNAKAKEYVKKRLWAVIQGYKVRRIMKDNRQVAQMKHELIDLKKFIEIL
jgi:hypothetical protein